MKPLHTVGKAADPGRVLRALVVKGAPRELGIGVESCNYFLYRLPVGMLARSSGTCFRPGLALTTNDCYAE
jgi:hypothetical protein